ncbi:MAG: DUF86 domain-containing protein [Candidatus Nanohalobium sp.]
MDERIEERMEEIDEYFGRLSTVREESEGVSREESEENLVRKISSAAIDIASRIISLEGGGRPDTYAEYFRELESRDVIDSDLRKRLEEMARFRNLIVHQYHKIDSEELERIIEEDLDDVREFLDAVRQYYSSQN